MFFNAVLGVGIGDIMTETVCLTNQWWQAEPWHPRVPHPGTELTHWCVSTMLTEAYVETGKYSRWEANISRGMWLMADDVLTKAKPSGIEPTAIVETRPGNQQHVFRIEGGCDVHHLRVLEAVWVKAGLTDPAAGSKGTVRLCRLPGSKPKDKQLARLADLTGVSREWHELMDVAGVKRKAADEMVAKTMAKETEALTGGDVESDPVFKMLRDKGMVQGIAGCGPWWKIVCPWCDEHSDGKPTGTRYLPSAEGTGGFVCDRGNSHKTKADFNRWVRDTQLNMAQIADRQGTLARIAALQGFAR
jgi:hypothetical protein